MTETTTHDVIVIGGGTMGTAAAWALARRDLRALVLEQFSLLHEMGSHGGETRITRQAYAESPEYVPIVQRADRLWQELEAESGEQIVVRCGGLELAAPGFSHARAARLSADEHGIPYEWLAPAEVNERWPAIRVPEGWDALYSPISGFVQTVPAIRNMARAAERRGVTILENSPVLDWGADSDSVWVETPSGRHRGDAAIVTAGAWAPRLLANVGLPLHVRRKTLWWQQVDDPERYRPDRFPVFITDSPAGEIYGFPLHGTPGLKMANHAGGIEVDPQTVDRETHAGENRDCLELAAQVLPGVRAEVVQSKVCLYTMTPDTDFIADRYPENPRIAIGTGFSGHGFKFAPAIGELLAELVVDPAARPIPRFSVSRFNGSGNRERAAD
ncbi:MAG: N-methyl-L-tryptophan oxidase [Thermomicrobiales bacterium]|nr:N-methyl-L-tryptophan oxidase [Thermomicrobiales bacterium]